MELPYFVICVTSGSQLNHQAAGATEG